MRLRDCLTVSLRDIRRAPVRSGLTLMALVLSTSLLVTLVTLGLQTRSAIVNQLGQDRTVNSVVVSSTTTLGEGSYGGNVQVADQARGVLTDATVTRLARIPGVASATPVVTVWQFRQFSISGFPSTFVARTNAVRPATTSLYALAAGRQLDAERDTPQVVVGHGYATAVGVGDNPRALVGRTVKITTQNNYRGQGAVLPGPDANAAEQKAFASRGSTLRAEVVGVTTADSSDNVLYIPLSWAHGIASVPKQTANGTKVEDTIDTDGYTSIIVQATSSADVRPVAAAVEAMGYGTASKQTQIDQINQLSTVMWIVLGSIAVISVISASLGIVNTMLMTVSEQRHAIGVWRACGATRSLIAGLFLVQAALLGLIGGALGTGIGSWVSSYVNGRIARLLHAQGLTALTIAPPSATSMVAAVALTTLLAVLAGLYPALRAARRIQL